MLKDVGNEFVARIADSLDRSLLIQAIAKGKISSAIMVRRDELDMSQKEFASIMGVSQAMVSKWESGECNFTLSTIAAICDKLGLVLELSLTKEEEYLAMQGQNWMYTKTNDPVRNGSILNKSGTPSLPNAA